LLVDVPGTKTTNGAVNGIVTGAKLDSARDWKSNEVRVLLMIAAAGPLVWLKELFLNFFFCPSTVEIFSICFRLRV
jgi:hypothetical protein